MRRSKTNATPVLSSPIAMAISDSRSTRGVTVKSPRGSPARCSLTGEALRSLMPREILDFHAGWPAELWLAPDL